MWGFSNPVAGATWQKDVTDMMLASLPERARRVRCAAVALRIGVEAFTAERGDAAPASEERRRRRRGRESSGVTTEMEGRTREDSPGVVGVVSSCVVARGVGERGTGCWARRPEEKKEE